APRGVAPRCGRPRRRRRDGIGRARATADGPRSGDNRRANAGAARRTTMSSMERKDVGDRQLDALLERLDRLCDEMHSLNRHLDTSEQLLRIARELSTLNESLQALAYAALGQQAPTVRRRRTG